MYRKVNKRFLDILISSLLIIVLSPIFLLVGLAVKFTSSGPVIFTQKRVGKDLKNFRVFKFRTMTNKKHEIKKIYGKSDELTPIGFYLRRFKIDELPQILNVLIGDMSLVGPRPGVPDQLKTMSDEEKLRYSIRPGITGLAQVSGNIYLDWKERFVFDLRYVENISFFNDIKIIFRTLMLILKGEESYVDKPLKIKIEK